MADEPQPRRKFLKVTCGALCAGLAATVGGPVIVSFLAPHRARTVTGGGEPMDYGKLSDLANGVPQKRDVVAERRDAWDRFEPTPIGAIWLVRHDDTVAAYSSVCPHTGCSISFDAKQAFVCPCHDSAFALADGAWLKGPSPRGMDPLPLEIKDGRIRVTYKRYRLGTKDRQES